MAWCVCLMVYTALPAFLEAMILLSPPDKRSVAMDVHRLKANGISLSGLYSEDINSPYFQQLPLLDNDLDLQDMFIGNSLEEQSQFRTRTPVDGDSVFKETGDDLQNPYSVESEHFLQKHEKQFLVGTGDMGYGYVYANNEILPRGYRDISEESDENSIVDEEEFPPADNSANAQNDDVFEENDRDDNSSDDEWRIIKDEDFSKQVQRGQSFQDLIGLMKVSSTEQSENEETTRRYRRSSRSRRPAPNTASRVDHRTRSRGQRRRSRDKRKRARIGGRGRGEVLKAEVEVLVVVENSIFRQFLASNYNNRQAALARLRRYYGIVVAMMDERFQTIEDRRLSITLSMSGMVIAETREDSGWLEKLVDWRGEAADGRASVNTDQALLDFGKWIKAKHKELPKFDHAMLFSGYQLTNKYGVPFAGKAYLNAVCDVEHGNAVSIVADRGDFQCVKVATHELAHSLGSVHDGDPGFEDCPYDSNYVMARVFSNELDTLRNAFYFSRCSIKQMKKLLRSKKAACVRDTPTVFYKYDLHRMPPGKIISPDQHCQRIYGPKSTFCNENEMKIKMCGQLWCRDPNQNNACRTNSYLTALPGTPCSQDKICHLGECLSRSDITERMLRSEKRRQRSRERQSSSSSSSSPSSTSDHHRSTASSSRAVVPGSSQSRLTGGDMDNTIPTVPQSFIRGRVARPSRARRLQLQKEREQRRRHKSRSGRRRTRPRNKSRRKGRCKADQPDKNVDYCRGIIRVNPHVCKRRDIRNYCCRTCAFRR